MLIQNIIQTQSHEGNFNYINVCQHQQLSVRRLLCTHEPALLPLNIESEHVWLKEAEFFSFSSFLAGVLRIICFFVAVFSLLSARVCSVGSGPWERATTQPLPTLDFMTKEIPYGKKRS